MDDAVLTVEEAARALRIGRSKLYELLTSGQIRSMSIGRRRLLTASAVADFIERQSLTSS